MSDVQPTDEQTDQDVLGDDEEVRENFPPDHPEGVDELIERPSELPDTVAERTAREEPEVKP